MKLLLRLLVLNLIFLLLFEAGRLYFVLYNARYFQSGLWDVFSKTAVYGFRLDLSAAAYCMIPFLLLGIASPFISGKSLGRISKIILFTEFFLIFLITLADPELYRQWGSKFNNQVLVYISHPREMAISSGSADFARTFLFALVLLSVYIGAWWAAARFFKEELDKPISGVLLSVLYSGISFVMLRGGLGVATISQASAIYTSDRAINSASINSLWNALYYLVNDSESLYGEGFKVADSAEAKSSFLKQTASDSAFLDLTDVLNPNILVVALESFTATASRFFYGQNNCTPGLDRAAQNNLSFMRCYASGDRTEKGLVSINSGYPAQPLSSVIIFPDKVAKLPGLSIDLKKQGYHNLFLYGGDVDFASMKSYLNMQEFAVLADKNQFRKEALTSKWGAHDGDLYKKALELLDATREPFYSLILTLSSHEPFDVPYTSPDLPKDNWYRFKNSIRYADQSLDTFLAVCSRQSWYKNTLIVLVADHGHDLGIENIHYFGPEKYHIPLVVCGGALKPELRGRQLWQPVSQTIVPGIIAHSLGLPAEAYRWQSGFRDSIAFAQYHFNNGFGRVEKQSWGVMDNAGGSFYFSGPAQDSATVRGRGALFQQVLIEDFLSK